jgi:hypothetical protein
MDVQGHLEHEFPVPGAQTGSVLPGYLADWLQGWTRGRWPIDTEGVYMCMGTLARDSSGLWVQNGLGLSIYGT